MLTSGSDKAWWHRFKGLLDGDQEWPSDYLFKFIVPREGLEDLKEIFGEHPVTVRASSRGNYVSVTARIWMDSSKEVVDVYRAASEVEGVISL